MGDLTIGMNSQMDTTVVSNQFIDRYMPSANGEYVKIYLYILRSVNHRDSTFSIESMAKQFDHTVSYILNALKYWASVGVLKLRYDSQNTLKHITFLDLDRSAREDSPQDDPSLPAREEDGLYQKRPYTLDEKQQFARDENFKAAQFITQTYFGKPLGPMQLENLMFIYDVLGFDNELIDFLVEYCVSRGKKNMRYVESTAIAWAKQGINTVALAKEHVTTFSRLSHSVMKAFGITSRSLVAEEQAYLDKWEHDYLMSEELILEACRRTVRSTGKGRFGYADSILASWKDAGLTTLKDVQNADEEHRKKSASARSADRRKNSKTPPFPQREYDMDSLERQLLHIK